MAEQFLHSTNVVAAFEQVGGEGVEGVAGGVLVDTGLLDGGFDGALEALFADVMAAFEV
ncbi:MAG: hypothetical protein JWL77_4763 [Chthonomonadaceae bacterium]|nr:hypothetical protein [Chthonomonadaceae bacterium]